MASDRPYEWTMRAGYGLVAVPISTAAQGAIVDNALRAGGTEASKRAGTKLASRLVGGGVAAAVFVVGESLIAVTFHGASWGEVADQAYATVTIIAVSEGAVLGAELLIYGELGSIGGPLGIAIAIGAAAVYEGVKYMWTSQRELEADRMRFVAKCDIARKKVSRWCNSMCETVATEAATSR
jgi:hypothetical protein